MNHAADDNAAKAVALLRGPAEEADSGVRGKTWQPVDLGPYLAGQVQRPEPSIGLARTDGLRLLYPGREHTVIGEMESGKSWFSIASSATELEQRRPVVYIHFEESDPSDTLERLQALGVPGHVILDLFRFVGPNEPVDPYVLAALLDPAPSLVVLDGVNEAMSMHDMGIRDEDGAAAFRRRLVKPCTATGAAVLADDHVVKDRDRRDRSPLGSIHKGNGLTGALILLENVDPFGRGERGCSHVYVTKDRPGHLRRHGRPDRRTPGKTYMGSLILDDTRTWSDCLDLTFLKPQDQDTPAEQQTTRAEQDDERVLSVVAELDEGGIQPTGRTVRARTGISKERTADALTRLVLDQKLREATGPRSARIFTVPEATVTGPTGPVLKDPGPVGPLDRPVPGPVGTSQDQLVGGSVS